MKLIKEGYDVLEKATEEAKDFITSKTTNSELAQTELFAPIASIIKASSNDEAIEFANDTIYGLSSAIFSQDEEKDKEYTLELKFGMTHIKDQTVNDELNVPFGGMRQSGIGRFGNL